MGGRDQERMSVQHLPVYQPTAANMAGQQYKSVRRQSSDQSSVSLERKVQYLPLLTQLRNGTPKQEEKKGKPFSRRNTSEAGLSYHARAAVKQWLTTNHALRITQWIHSSLRTNDTLSTAAAAAAAKHTYLPTPNASQPRLDSSHKPILGSCPPPRLPLQTFASSLAPHGTRGHSQRRQNRDGVCLDGHLNRHAACGFFLPQGVVGGRHVCTTHLDNVS